MYIKINHLVFQIPKIHLTFRCFVKAKSASEINWENCKCVPKFPKDEIQFYGEQKFVREGKITTTIDVRGSKQIQKKVEKELKKQKEPERLEEQRKRESSRLRLVDPSQASALIPDDDFDDFIAPDNVYDEEFADPDSTQPRIRNRSSHKNFIAYAKRKGNQSLSFKFWYKKSNLILYCNRYQRRSNNCYLD